MIETFANSLESNEQDFDRILEAVAYDADAEVTAMESVNDYISKLLENKTSSGSPFAAILYFPNDGVTSADDNVDLTGIGPENHGTEVHSIEKISESAESSADMASFPRRRFLDDYFTGHTGEFLPNQGRRDIASFLDIDVGVVESEGPTAIGRDTLTNDAVGIVTLYLAVVCYCIETSDDLRPIRVTNAPNPIPKVITINRVEEAA
ncbi:hypothetical protein ACHAXS_013910 [Conticribra weissflogii]